MELGGVTEVAVVLGVSKQRVMAIRVRPNFPQPEARLAQGPVWDIDKVKRWARSSRQPRGRPRTIALRRQLAGRYEVDDVPERDGGSGFRRATDLVAVASGVRPYVVAVRLLERPGSPQVFEQTLGRLEALRANRHPHVVPILGYGSDADKRPFYVVPLPHRRLEAAVRAGETDDAVILTAMRSLCSAAGHLLSLDFPVGFGVTAGAVFQMDSSAWCIADLRPDGWPITTRCLIGQLRDLIRSLTSAGPASETPVFRKSLEWLDARLGKRSPDMAPEVLVGVVQDDLAEISDMVARSSGRSESYDSSIWIHEAVRSGTLDDDVLVAAVSSMVAADDGASLRRRLQDSWAVPREQALATITSLSTEQLDRLQQVSPGVLSGALLEWSRELVESPLDQAAAEASAGLLGRAMHMQDERTLPGLLQAAVWLVSRYPTWHNRGMLVSALQEVRDPQRAAIAAESLKACDPMDLEAALAWIDSEWLHPVLRQGLESVRPSEFPSVVDITDRRPQQRLLEDHGGGPRV